MHSFDDVVKLARASEGKAGQLWTAMVLFCMDRAPADDKAAKELFKAHEKQEERVKLQTIGAYRSAKSVIVAALKFGVTLNVGDKVRGKTEVEKEIKDLKEPEAPLATIQRCIELANKKMPAITGKDDAMVVYGLARALLTAAEAKVRSFLPAETERLAA